MIYLNRRLCKSLVVRGRNPQLALCTLRAFHQSKFTWQQQQQQQQQQEHQNYYEKQQEEGKRRKHSLLKLSFYSLLLGTGLSLAKMAFDNRNASVESQKDLFFWQEEVDSKLPGLYTITLSQLNQIVRFKNTHEALLKHFAPDVLVGPDLNFDFQLNIDLNTGETLEGSVTPIQLFNKCRTGSKVDYLRNAYLQIHPIPNDPSNNQQTEPNVSTTKVGLLRVSHVFYQIPLVVIVKQRDQVVKKVPCHYKVVYVKYDDMKDASRTDIPQDRWFHQLSSFLQVDELATGKNSGKPEVAVVYERMPGGIFIQNIGSMVLEATKTADGHTIEANYGVTGVFTYRKAIPHQDKKKE